MDNKTSQDLLAKVRAERNKQANDPISAVQHVTSSKVRQEALNDIGKVMLFGAGAGAAGRGTVGLLNLLRSKPKTNLRSGPAMTPLPLPYTPEPELEEEPLQPQIKLAGNSFLAGDMATQKSGIPWYQPAMLMGGLAAGYGGWKAVDHILDQRRQHDIEDELQAARGDFQKALIGQYDGGIKKASEQSPMEKLSADLDLLFDKFQEVAEKSAAETTWGDIGGNMTGMYGMYAAPAALAAGYAAYSMGKKSQRRTIIDKALKRRAQRNAAMQPDEMYAMPVPVPS